MRNREMLQCQYPMEIKTMVEMRGTELDYWLGDEETQWDSLVSLKLFTRNTRLVEARRAKGVNQAQMARDIEMGDAKLSRIENLKFVPSVPDQAKIAAYLGQPIAYLFPDILMKAIEEGVFSHRDAQLAEPEIISLAEAAGLRLTYDGETQMIEEVERRLLKEEIDTVLDTLAPREKQVLELRFGLVDGKSRTLEEVAQEMPRERPLQFGVGHITRERIRQIEARALRLLRHPARARKLKDYLD